MESLRLLIAAHSVADTITFRVMSLFSVAMIISPGVITYPARVVEKNPPVSRREFGGNTCKKSVFWRRRPEIGAEIVSVDHSARFFFDQDGFFSRDPGSPGNPLGYKSLRHAKLFSKLGCAYGVVLKVVADVHWPKK